MDSTTSPATSPDPVSRASLRVLVAVARADGRIGPGEREALEEALGGRDEVVDALLDELLEAEIDVAAEIAVLPPAARRELYQAAFLLAHADGEASVGELMMLDLIRGEPEPGGVLQQIVAETRDTLSPSGVLAQADPEARALEIREDITKYSLLAAILGANPVAGAAVLTDLVVVASQVKMVRDIGLYHGHQLDQASARALLTSMIGGVGIRLALGQLARVIPGFGSVYGAVTAFATTWAVGRVAERYFGEGASTDTAALQDRFKAARAEGEAIYREKQSLLALKADARAARIAALNEDLAAGRLTAEAYQAAIEAL